MKTRPDLTRVIIIEDDLDGREVLAEALRINEFEIVGTGINGLEAIELYKKHRPDVTLMNFLMPEYDGLYGTKKIREFDNTAKVIILSASTNPDEKNKLKQHGAIDVITKPYELDVLVRMINRCTKTNKAEEKQLPL